MAQEGKFLDEMRRTDYYYSCITAGTGRRSGRNDSLAGSFSALRTPCANPQLTEKSRNIGDSCNSQGILD